MFIIFKKVYEIYGGVNSWYFTILTMNLHGILITHPVNFPCCFLQCVHRKFVQLSHFGSIQVYDPPTLMESYTWMMKLVIQVYDPPFLIIPKLLNFAILPFEISFYKNNLYFWQFNDFLVTKKLLLWFVFKSQFKNSMIYNNERVKLAKCIWCSVFWFGVYIYIYISIYIPSRLSSLISLMNPFKDKFWISRFFWSKFAHAYNICQRCYFNGR